MRHIDFGTFTGFAWWIKFSFSVARILLRSSKESHLNMFEYFASVH